MKKLKDDWRIATLFEKVRFILVGCLILIVGIIGIYEAVIFSIEGIARNAITAIGCCAVLLFLGVIRLGPKGKETAK